MDGGGWQAGMLLWFAEGHLLQHCDEPDNLDPCFLCSFLFSYHTGEISHPTLETLCFIIGIRMPCAFPSEWFAACVVHGEK